jgi:hypothetical protein
MITVGLGAGATSQTAAFLVDLASTQSWVDVTALTQPTGATCSSTTCTWPDFGFFGSWGQVTLQRGDFSAFTGPPRQAGILGTDFLSVRPSTVDYSGRRLFSASAASFCTPQELEDAGFVAAPSTGFFSSNLSTLAPLALVVADAGAGLHVPNVPTVRLRIDGVTAYAQLDTGFDDRLVAGSININQAFLQALQAQAPSALVRAPTLDLQLTTCVGLAEPVTAWRVAPGHVVEFVTADGGVPSRLSSTVLFAKNTPAAARVCGGIGTWSVSAAQVASSHLAASGTVVFDSVRSLVWLPR